MITERFTRNCNKVEVFKWVITRMQPNGIRDHKEDAPQNSAITISWQGNDVAVSASDDSQALPGTSIAQACLTAGDDLGISVLPNAQEGWADRAWSDPCNRAATQDG
jgi:hypothetical protein